MYVLDTYMRYRYILISEKYYQDKTIHKKVKHVQICDQGVHYRKIYKKGYGMKFDIYICLYVLFLMYVVASHN